MGMGKTGIKGVRGREEGMIYLQTLVGGKKNHLLGQGVSDRSETAGKRCTVPMLGMLGTAWVPRARLGPPESLTPSLAFLCPVKSRHRVLGPL